MINMNNRSKLLWTAIPLILFPACGGGGGGGHSGTPPSALQYSDPFSVYMVDQSHAPLTPSITGDVTAWSIAPALPSGLVLDPLTGEITGTPQASALRGSYVVKASNHSGTAQTTIEISVEKPERYAYVTCPDDRTISILALDAQSGSVSRRGFVVGQPWEGHTECFVPNTHRPFGYSTTHEGVLTTWSVDETSGWLTELDALAVDFGPHALALSPDGRFVFVANCNGNNVTVFRADNVNGLLVQVAPGLGVPAQPVAIAINPAGTRLAVASQGDSSSGIGSSLTLYSINPNSGELLASGDGIVLNGAQPSSCAFSIDRDVLYVGLPQVGRLLAVAYDTASGLMTSLGSAASGTGCGAIALDPLGHHAWAVNATAGTLAAFSIQSNGALSTLGAQTTGSAPASLAIDPIGRFLFALDSTTQELGLYDLNPQSGSATHRTGWLTRGAPAHVSFGRGEHALSATSSELLAAAFVSDELHSHPVDGVSGAIGAGTLVPTQPGPLSLTVDARQRFVFTGNAQDNSIGRYRIDPVTSALTSLGAVVPTAGVPISVAADASGRFLYVATREVADPTDGFVVTYSIDPSNGALTLQGSVASGFEPNWIGIDPTGQFLYVANTGNGTSGSATIAVFRLAAVSGLPTGPAVTHAAPGVWTLGFHPSGRFLYAALRNANSTVPYQIDKTDGTISAVDAGVSGAAEPMSVVVGPDGRFAYVAYRNNGGAGTIGQYAIDPTSGVLVPPVSPFQDGIAPLDLVIDVTGHFLYSANSGTDSVSAYAIGAADGFLQPLTPAPSGVAPSAILLLQRWQ